MSRPLVLLAAIVPLLAAAETLIGGVDHVRDGDALVVSGVPIRLQVQVPRCRCSETASGRCRNRLSRIRDNDHSIGVCRLDDGRDIAAILVSEGIGRDCPRYSDGQYADDETDRSRNLLLPRYCRPRWSANIPWRRRAMSGACPWHKIESAPGGLIRRRARGAIRERPRVAAAGLAAEQHAALNGELGVRGMRSGTVWTACSRPGSGGCTRGTGCKAALRDIWQRLGARLASEGENPALIAQLANFGVAGW